MSAKEELKILIKKNALTVKRLAEILTARTGEKYTQSCLQNKISLSPLNYDEME